MTIYPSGGYYQQMQQAQQMQQMQQSQNVAQVGWYGSQVSSISTFPYPTKVDVAVKEKKTFIEELRTEIKEWVKDIK